MRELQTVYKILELNIMNTLALYFKETNQWVRKLKPQICNNLEIVVKELIAPNF